MKKSQDVIIISPYQPIIEMVTNGLDSPHSQRAYKRALNDFLGWYVQSDQEKLDRRSVGGYVAHLRDVEHMAAANINLRLVAIRRLAREAALNDVLDERQAIGIEMLKGVRHEGVQTGNWLTKREAKDLIDTPDVSKPKGLRDRAILATLIGTGLRREELSSLTFEHLQQRDGRWAIIDITGKRNKIRTIPMASWNKAIIDNWATGAKPQQLTTGKIFRPVNKGGSFYGEKLSERAIHDIVSEHALEAGLVNENGECLIAPHDLRRTFAKLALKGGASIEQISLSLGHESIETTQKYLGIEQDFSEAPCDKLGLQIQALHSAWAKAQPMCLLIFYVATFAEGIHAHCLPIGAILAEVGVTRCTVHQIV